MQLDFTSMAILISLHLMVVGAALPFVMGTDVSTAARHSQKYFCLQALAWALILVASHHREHSASPWISLMAASLASAAQWQMAQVLQNWLGARPLRRLLVCVCFIGPLGFAVFLDNVPLRLMWYSTCHAVSIALLGWMCLYPQRSSARNWRYLLAGCAFAMGLSLLCRAVMASHTLLQEFTQNTQANHWFAIMSQICSSLVMISLLVAWREEANHKLQDLAMSDQLTTLANRYALNQVVPNMLALAKRQRLPLAVVLLDLDHFKAINDEHGHCIGDRTLQLFAHVLKAHVRPEEIAARWGGEEFCLLLYADEASVQHFFQRLSSTLLQRSQQDLGFALYISAGCALQRLHDAEKFAQLLERADAALYMAKQTGRRKIAFAPSIAASPPLAPTPSL